MLELFSAKSAILACVVGLASLVTSTFFTYSSPVVTLQDGRVQGKIGYSRQGKEYLEYLGIPYAEPPVGDLRFQPPLPVKPWTGVKQVTQYPPFCVQFDALVRARTYGVEDCLQLNVFTHSVNPKVRKPVMVYIHGGGFFSGGASMYGPRYFMDHDFVLVVLQYRLGALGFLNTGDELVRGNMGLKDQLLALKWVQKNIASFGGDPYAVTIFGESAGGASVHYHILSPASKSLFHRAIVQSGSTLCPWSMQKRPSEVSMGFGKAVNCHSDNTSALVDCLMRLDAKDLVKPQMQFMIPYGEYHGLVPSVETVLREDTFLSEFPVKLLRAGRFAKVPLMIGFTSGEGGLLSSRFEAMPEKVPGLEKNWSEIIPQILLYDKTKAGNEEAAQKIREFYFGTNSFTSDPHDFQRNLTKLFSDSIFFEPIQRTALNHARQGVPTYTYVYDYVPNWMPGIYSFFRGVRPDHWMASEVQLAFSIASDWFKKHVLHSEGPHEFGATHADDLFQLWNAEWIAERMAAGEVEFSEKFVKLFVDFARNEESLEFNGVPWPALQAPSEKANSSVAGPPLQYMLIDQEGRVIEDPFADRIRFWQSLGIREA